VNAYWVNDTTDGTVVKVPLRGLADFFSQSPPHHSLHHCVERQWVRASVRR
jgi:hypothetical protein